MSRFFFDTEFMEDGHTIELLSIGMVCEDGREFYAESTDADWSHANDWVKANVLVYLNPVEEGHPRSVIAERLREFVAAGGGTPEFWAYYADYDWVVLCQLYGCMVDLPDGWPMFCMDLKQRAVDLGNPTLPEQGGSEHHALADARWNQQVFAFLERVAS